MCGIFGYIGTKNNAAEMIFEGLRVLEYRGYDSWGITVRVGNKLAIEKHVGKIANTKINLPASNLGIGHTRWATHGGVTEKNAHPHLDCTKEIAVLHNGIVENFQILKENLIKKGHTFLSETDTEVIPHMIEELVKSRDFPTAVKDTFSMLKGLNAILVVHTASSMIVAAKNGSPLVIGVGKEEFFIASDAVGILPYTRKILFLKDNEMVVLGNKLTLFSLPEGRRETPHIETIQWKIEHGSKGTFNHFMLKEIFEQPKIIRNIAENYSDQIEDLREVVDSAQGTFFIGAGTAYHACMAGMYLLSKIAKKHVNTAPASEFNYLEDFLTNKSLIIALSQSGETIDVIEPLTRAQKKGSKIVALVNALGSTIYRMANYKVLLGAGPEKAVASTKAYISKLSVLFLLSYAVANRMSEGRELLLKAADEVERILSNENIITLKKIAKSLAKKDHIYTIGRGVSYASALEGALKIKEVTYIHTEGLAGGELKHGPIALIEKGTPCIVFAPKDDSHDAIISNATEIKARGGIIIGVSSEKSAIFDYFIDVKETELCSIITHVIPMQIIAYYMALEKHLDPDKPRNLAKSVTVK
jgi:glucosamine--fructose-6-phosphate aminotransferase (isomerizing)